MNNGKLDKKSIEMLDYIVANNDQNSTILAAMMMTHYSHELESMLRILRLLRNMQLVDCKIDEDKHNVLVLQVTQQGLTYKEAFQEEVRSENERVKKQRIWDVKIAVLGFILSIIGSVGTAVITSKFILNGGV